MNPYTQKLLQALESTTGTKPIRNDRGWKCRCPAHDDAISSLSIADGENGGTVIKCFAGCEPSASRAAAGGTGHSVDRTLVHTGVSRPGEAPCTAVQTRGRKAEKRTRLPTKIENRLCILIFI